ncbi:GNAT family N-acetyltransferase [Roseiconus lacunae]|uniref:GNAT family N-acetyltransferase n=1 Tax=Roseiconus lacunae TaxID=2605694 RepID=UPI001E58F438|nr:GNAT family N-acetyltransferase [Roseiconus lacunae]MCD0458117.1 GNAT family N-acetyltransferase [Roseiconus lacunae]WRQ53692.1 GNAT family N-acetyltransferase [Stieleria sp. HD01]
MFHRDVDEQIRLQLAMPFHADQLFELTDRNRDFLRPWLGWIDATRGPDDSRTFLSIQLDRFGKGQALTTMIYFDGVLVGVAGYHSIDQANRVGCLGYWLDQGHTGNGIMTRVVQDLVNAGRECYSLGRIEIRCSTENERSRSVAQRLGFMHRGTCRHAEKVGDVWHDHDVYVHENV